ncbi:AbrB/MazE/SpoVT family DNA-binding domain-containing protein [Paenibacillus melissococcoides]|uniref:AbrB/MazE/SpoVT family DNA-binding domain-containing protein n=1 Tax=Paenibacillus melissococcoides TaxID=2912268 RepID=A0ABM9GEE1_9BACL|nr:MULTISPECIES: AbrB/MazE/SpoVT family DNA-binding domain-containing protein [Paenibacillus]MEB9898095.1 AbrB/MazE/SpoVT family DNA-binding domain-containing protein [Bacillus cereus]CAH8249668.1 AbrB/MazE/SpoVT family DNA-binding domain-containing protein [Paenibacillus melissococcoides]CAH8721497.1 AbrB/MazE/SpoVT family DNA-binding domain-containing protein [Paenibacillus melissococcoides]CAH8721722.1 AbrB/MazE/SpoVT family DNA-binding domain-containing protein [Paenibacillus melissococcoid
MKRPKGKYAWTAKVGEKGQIVIPKEARDIFGIQPGDTLLLLGDEEQGIAIVKGDKFTELANKIFGAQGKGEGE